MIPEEVVVIAETLAIEYTGSGDNYEQFIVLAYKIYNRLKFCSCD
jgi:hypothetical protein